MPDTASAPAPPAQPAPLAQPIPAPAPALPPAPPPVSDVRRVADSATVLAQLGALADLPGLWVGTGFNLVARPDFAARSVPPGPNEPSHLFLELNFTVEALKFDTIASPIPNRGFAQHDIELHGIHYLQQITDRDTGSALHIEPGIWVNIPQTTEPSVTPSVARMASIPHGTVMLAEGTAATLPGGPAIPPANTVPFGVGTPIPAPGDASNNGFAEYHLNNPAGDQFRTRTGNVPGLTQDMIDDPNSILRSALQGFTVQETTALQIATVPSVQVLDAPAPPPPATQPGSTTVTFADGGGGAQNIPFLQANASTGDVFATFWIEKIQDPDFPGRNFLQLQYSQTVLLNFPLDVPVTAANPAGLVNLSWPHVSVATLVKQF
jgi:hypothetical protein